MSAAWAPNTYQGTRREARTPASAASRSAGAVSGDGTQRLRYSAVGRQVGGAFGNIRPVRLENLRVTPQRFADGKGLVGRHRRLPLGPEPGLLCLDRRPVAMREGQQIVAIHALIIAAESGLDVGKTRRGSRCRHAGSLRGTTGDQSTLLLVGFSELRPTAFRLQDEAAALVPLPCLALLPGRPRASQLFRRGVRRAGGQKALTCSVSASTCTWSVVIRLSLTSCSCRISIRRASIRASRLAMGRTAATAGGTLRPRGAICLAMQATLPAASRQPMCCSAHPGAGPAGRRPPTRQPSRTSGDHVPQIADPAGLRVLAEPLPALRAFEGGAVERPGAIRYRIVSGSDNRASRLHQNCRAGWASWQVRHHRASLSFGFLTATPGTLAARRTTQG